MLLLPVADRIGGALVAVVVADYGSVECPRSAVPATADARRGDGSGAGHSTPRKPNAVSAWSRQLGSTFQRSARARGAVEARQPWAPCEHSLGWVRWRADRPERSINRGWRPGPPSEMPTRDTVEERPSSPSEMRALRQPRAAPAAGRTVGARGSRRSPRSAEMGAEGCSTRLRVAGHVRLVVQRAAVTQERYDLVDQRL